MNGRQYLREVQYRDDTNLNARVELHRRFSVNSGSFHRWVFDQLDVPDRARLLEVGCGPGHLWAANRERMPAGWEAFLSDFSYGMITAARSRLGAGFRLEVADAEALPHPSGTFHAAIANHMLYHVQNRPRAIRELARVLQPDGALFAVTNGREHLRELDELMARWLPPGAGSVLGAEFELENGAEQLAAGFAEVELRLWRDALEVTDAEAIVAYVRSLPVGSEADTDGLRHEATAAIEREGAFKVRKATGLFIARSPIQSSP